MYTNLQWICRSAHKKKTFETNKHYTRGIDQFSFEWKFIQHFNSIKEAVAFHKGSRATIIIAAKNNNRTAYGFKWKETDDNIDNTFEKIKLFPDYSVSIDGKIYSYLTNRIIKPTLNNGYMKLRLAKKIEGEETVYLSVAIHIMVAMTFIPNTDSKPYVNHINGNKIDNNMTNLEWVTNIENVLHAMDTGLNTRRVEVEQYTLNGIYLNSYDSVINGAKNCRKNTTGDISSTCRERLKHAYGFIWKYKKK
jgi:hypothetical protein